MGWFVIGGSLFSSNIGSEHLVGLAGSGAQSGVAMAHYELHAWLLLMLGWVFVPFYNRSGIFTMPEFLEKRYNPFCRWFLSLISLIAYIFTKVSVALYAAGIVFKALFPEPLIEGMDNFWLGAIGVVVLTGLYTVIGGFRAVVYTDTIQTIILLIGSAFLVAIGLHQVGGWGQLRTICGSEYFNLWKPADDPNFPWPGMLFCAPIVGMWYWCTDQYIVQRTLSAKDETQARRGSIFAAYLKLTPLFIFIIPGMIAFALDKMGKIRLPAGDQAYPVLVKAILPVGVRGIVVASLLAALMSSLSAMFNSCSTLFTIDIYKKMRPLASEQHLVRVGQIATTIVVILGILWIPLMKYISAGLYQYLQSVQAYIAPPITAVFLFGLFSSRINATGCVVGLVGGFILGMGRLAAELFAVPIASAFEKTEQGSLASFGLGLLHQMAPANFLYFSVVLFLICIVLIILASMLGAKPSPEKLRGLTYATATAGDKQTSRASWNKTDVIHSLIVLSIIVVIYLYFRG